jgi:hypothetical protein
MTQELFEIDKKTLEEYYKRLLKTNYQFKFLQLRFIWNFIHDRDSFRPLCDLLKTKGQRYELDAYGIVDLNKIIILPDKHDERIYLSYFIIEKILKPKTNPSIKSMSLIGRNYAENKEGDESIFFELFNDLFLEPFIYFLLNHTNKHFWVLGLLKKYKHRTEWFNRELLYKIATDETQKAEHNLKSNLYKYLFDNGLDFYIEPNSPSGEIDFIGSQKNSTNKLLAEGKVFNGIKANIVKGIWQIHTYIKENNEKDGYLIIYSICPKIISFNFNNDSDSFPYCILDNKRIYFVVIDIYSHGKTAAIRGQQDLIEINNNDLIK